jgi:hypothetical protein
MSIRLFGGVRGLHFSADSESTFQTTFSYGGGLFTYGVSFSDTTKTEFFGVGPRIGVAAAHRFEGTNFGLSGTVAGALLFGRQTTTSTETVTFSYSNPGSSYSNSSSYSDSFSTNKTVFDLEAKAGLDYYLNDSTALTIGYQAQKLWNVGPDNDPQDSKLVHGPFLSLTGSID